MDKSARGIISRICWTGLWSVLIAAIGPIAGLASNRSPTPPAVAESSGTTMPAAASGSLSAEAFLATAAGDTLWLLEEYVVWGDRIHAVTDYASRVDVVDSERIESVRRTPGANAMDAIGILPGVTYDRVGLVANGASGDPPAAFRIRGIGSIPNDGLLVLVDGRPQYVGLWGHSLADAHQLGPVKRIEVIRGPASVQYGSQAFAGAINIITTGSDPFGTQLQATGGNHGTYDLLLDHRQPLGPAELGLSTSRARTDGYRGGDEGWVDRFRGHLNWAVSDRWTASASADGTDSFFNSPGPETWPTGSSNPYDDPDFGSGRIRQRAVDLALDGRAERWTTRVKLFHNYVHNDFHAAGNTRARDFGLRLFGEVRRPSYSLKAGFDLDRYGGNFTVNGDPSFTPVDKYDVNSAPYLLARYQVSERLSAAGGLRVNWSDRYDTEWIPQARLRYEAGPQVVLTLSAAKGFKTPSVAQQYLPFFAGDRTLLEPETIWQYEIGLSLRSGRWALEWAAFQSEGDNLIRREGLGWPPVYANSGSFRHQGLETTLRGKLSDNSGATLAWTWMIARDDQTLAVPAAAYRLDVWTRPHRTVKVDLSWRVELDRYGADSEQERLRDLYLASAGVSWDAPWRLCQCPGSRTELFLTAANLGDRRYRVFADYPMPGLTYAAGVRLIR